MYHVVQSRLVQKNGCKQSEKRKNKGGGGRLQSQKLQQQQFRVHKRPRFCHLFPPSLYSFSCPSLTFSSTSNSLCSSELQPTIVYYNVRLNNIKYLKHPLKRNENKILTVADQAGRKRKTISHIVNGASSKIIIVSAPHFYISLHFPVSLRYLFQNRSLMDTKSIGLKKKRMSFVESFFHCTSFAEQQD